MTFCHYSIHYHHSAAKIIVQLKIPVEIDILSLLHPLPLHDHHNRLSPPHIHYCQPPLLTILMASQPRLWLTTSSTSHHHQPPPLHNYHLQPPTTNHHWHPPSSSPPQVKYNQHPYRAITANNHLHCQSPLLVTATTSHRHITITLTTTIPTNFQHCTTTVISHLYKLQSPPASTSQLSPLTNDHCC